MSQIALAGLSERGGGVGRVCGGEIEVVVKVVAVVTLEAGGGECASRCGGKRLG